MRLLIILMLESRNWPKLHVLFKLNCSSVKLWFLYIFHSHVLVSHICPVRFQRFKCCQHFNLEKSITFTVGGSKLVSIKNNNLKFTGGSNGLTLSVSPEALFRLSLITARSRTPWARAMLSLTRAPLLMMSLASSVLLVGTGLHVNHKQSQVITN